MSDRSWTSWLVNGALGVLALLAVALLYGLISGALFHPSEPVREEDSSGLVSDIIQVEVLNGCGVSGLAAETREYLVERRFDVVNVGDYEHFDRTTSVVIDRVGNSENASRVAEALGIPPERVLEEVRPDFYLDATVVLGSDYAALAPFEDQAGDR